MTLKFAKKIAFLAIVPLMASLSFAQLNPEDTKVFDAYTKEISSANPIIAKKFLEDNLFIDKIKISSPAIAAQLISKAQAVDDLSRLLDKRLYKRREYELSKALELRIDNNKALSSVGIGPFPETLIPWIKKYKKKYSKSKVGLIESAIRKYEVVFGTKPLTSDAKKRYAAAWRASTIEKRNSFLSRKAAKSLDKFIRKESRTDAAYQNVLINADVFKYLDASGQARFSKYMKQMSAVEKAKTSLTKSQIDQFNDQPITQQMFLLGKIFDQSDMNAGAIETKVNALRESRSDEAIRFQDNKIITALLKTAMREEIKGTIAGDKLLKFYKPNEPAIAIASCQNCYAKYEPSKNRIVFDSDLILQYLRIKGLTSEDLEGAEINKLAKYLSPMFIHEGIHQRQHAWADKNKIYKFYTQEDEIEANSMEALYTVEKLKNDTAFKNLMKEMRPNCEYADKRIKAAARFKKSRDGFESDIRQLHYYALPSFESSRAEILKVISGELIRRENLDAAALRYIEVGGKGITEVMEMRSSRLISKVRDIKTFALKKVQNDLLNPAVYTEHYDNAKDWAEDMLILASAGKKSSKIASDVPAFKQ